MTYMIFDGQSLEDKFTITDIRGRGILVNEIETIDVAGRAGAYFVSRNIPVRVLEIDIIIASDNPSNLRKDIRELNAILSVDEPKQIVFSDDEEISYYGIPAESQEGGEIVATSESTLVIICADPFAYSDEKAHRFELDVTTLTNEGSEEAEPVFELHVLAPVTFAMIQNQYNEYQMIGMPVDDDEDEIVDTKTLVYELDSMDGWSPTTNQPDPETVIGRVVEGEMTYDGTGIVVTDYGEWPSEVNGYGPSIIRELPEALQDFEIETIFDTRTDLLEENFRIEIHLFDEGMNHLGKIGIRDRFYNFHNRSGLARVGEYVDSRTRYLIGSNNYDYNDFGKSSMFFMRMRREGNRFDVYLAQVVNGIHQDVITRSYIDSSERWLGRLKFVQIYIRTFQDRREPYLARVNRLDIYRLSQEVEEYQVPYIADYGDIITFDHRNDEILINGESRKDIKDFGGQYFTLKKGDNELVVHPSDSFRVIARYRETHR